MSVRLNECRLASLYHNQSSLSKGKRELVGDRVSSSVHGVGQLSEHELTFNVFCHAAVEAA